jgi:translation initiation factor 1 (eIF-1/SUI1)
MIVLQGDHRSKVTEFLLTKGYSRESIEVIWSIENNIQRIFL